MIASGLLALGLLATGSHTHSIEPAGPIERLEITNEVESEQLDADAIRIAIMSEAVDHGHPAFDGTDIRTWRFPVRLGEEEALAEPARPLLDQTQWHGTHVASILAAGCSTRSRGVACNASVDVYDFGVYGDFVPGLDEREEGAVEADFMRRTALAFAHARNRGVEIANLSFNVEAPVVAATVQGGGGQSITALSEMTGMRAGLLFAERERLRRSGILTLEKPEDWDYLASIGVDHSDPPALIIGMMLPHSREWRDLGGAIADFQAGGGVVVISESNNRFEGRSGVLNALPTTDSRIDPDRWLSIVYVRTEGEGYATDLNGCGIEASGQCIAVHAPEIFAAIPEEGWRSESGHSMATPMVSGLLALILQKARRTDRTFSAANAVCLLRSTVRKDFPGYDRAVHGLGLLDAGAALLAAGQRLPDIC